MEMPQHITPQPIASIQKTLSPEFLALDKYENPCADVASQNALIPNVHLLNIIWKNGSLRIYLNLSNDTRNETERTIFWYRNSKCRVEIKARLHYTILQVTFLLFLESLIKIANQKRIDLVMWIPTWLGLIFRIKHEAWDFINP